MRLFKFALTYSAAIVLAACGGGGGGGATGGTSLSGKVIDGPISGATVCLDVNANYACDTGEPTATTDSRGNYTLPSYSGSVSGLHILAVVPAGAIDLDTNTPITTGYVLMSPASNPSAVTPLTTLVSTQMQVNPSLSATQAEQMTLVSNRLTEQTSSLLDKDPTQSSGLLKVAQTVATAIAQTSASLGNNATFTAAAQASTGGRTETLAATQAMRLTQADLLLKMQNSDGGINSVYHNGTAVNTTAVTTLANNTINDAINYIAATTKAGKFGNVDMASALQSGITGIKIARGGYYVDASNVERSTGSRHYMTLRLTTDASKNGNYRYVGSAWRPDSVHNFNLVNGTWVAQYGNIANSITATPPTISGNCITVPQTPQGINGTFCATSVDLAGKKLSDFNFDCKDPTGVLISGCDVNAVFPAGARGYNFQGIYDEDQYQLEVMANDAGLASNMTSFISTYSTAGGPYRYFVGTKLAMNIASYNAATKTGTLNWYDNRTGSFTAVADTSNFSVESKNGIDILTANFPNIYYQLGGGADQTVLYAYAPAGTNTGSQAGIYGGHKYSSKLATNIYFGLGEMALMNATAYNFISNQYGLAALP